MADLNCKRIINEPTAAAIFYAFKNQNQNKKILIFDFGGGTFDVSIAEIRNNSIIVKAYRGDSKLGGEDIDEILVKKFLSSIQEEEGVDLREDKKALAKLK